MILFARQEAMKKWEWIEGEYNNFFAYVCFTPFFILLTSPTSVPLFAIIFCGFFWCPLDFSWNKKMCVYMKLTFIYTFDRFPTYCTQHRNHKKISSTICRNWNNADMIFIPQKKSWDGSKKLLEICLHQTFFAPKSSWSQVN